MRGAACGSKHLITVCLVEDDDFFRARVEGWLKQADDMKCVGSYSSGETALPDILEKKPDVIVLDFGLPGIKGSECLRLIKGQVPTVRVLVLTGIPDDSVVFTSLAAGADGFLEKSDRFSRQEQLLDQIREMHNGGTPLSGRASTLLVEAFRRFKPKPWEDKDFSPLTEREQEILKQLRNGASSKEIAQLLGISVHTVNNHLRAIYEKLGVHSGTQAIFKIDQRDGV